MASENSCRSTCTERSPCIRTLAMLNEDQANKTQCHQQVHDNYDLFQHLQLPAARQIAPNSSALRRLHLPAPIDIRHAEQLGCTCRLYTAAVKESHTFATSAFSAASCARIAACTSWACAGTRSTRSRSPRPARKPRLREQKLQHPTRRSRFPAALRQPPASCPPRAPPGSPDTQHRHQAARLSRGKLATHNLVTLAENQATLRSGPRGPCYNRHPPTDWEQSHRSARLASARRRCSAHLHRSPCRPGPG